MAVLKEFDGTAWVPVGVGSVAQIPGGSLSYPNSSGTPTVVPRPYGVNVLDYGAVGDGSTDDTTAIQAAITACPAGGQVFFPAKKYKITATLVINKALTLQGESMSVAYGPISSGSNIDAQNLPVAAPFLRGAVLNMRTAATDAVSITTNGEAVNVYDLGVLFGASGDTVIMQNTGHGFVGLPPVFSSKRDQGVMGATWKNVAVYGHDGNHYAYKFTNLEYSTFIQVVAFGGGGWFEDTAATYDSSPGGYGNNVFINPYFVVIAAGTAHGVERSLTQTILLEKWDRPQIWMWVPNGTTAGLPTSTLTGPTGTQRVWKDDANGLGTTVDSPDFETSVAGGSQFDPQGIAFTGNWYFGTGVTPVGGFIYLPGKMQTTLTGTLDQSDMKSLSVPGSLSGYHSKTCTVTAGTALGTSPPAITSTVTAVRGTVQFGTGTSPAAGRLVQIGIPAAAQGESTIVPVVTAMNAATQALGLYVTITNGLFCEVNCVNAPAASQAGTTYAFAVHLIA